MLQKVVIICGPTCTGKTKLGVLLAKEFNGEIISCDSQQVYKGLDIGTAKPSKADMSNIPHHLIDVASPDEQFDAARFVELADTAIREIAERGRIPFVVGGTGLYIKALCHGLTASGGRDEGYRKKLAEKGVPVLYQILRDKDPEAAQTIKPNDSSRIIRALEVLHVTGRSIRNFNDTHGFKERRYDTLKIGLNVERGELYRRIEERVDRMLQDGLKCEVEGLLKKYGPEAPALKAVGYKEGLRIEEIKKNSRRFAKRQFTWFRADKEIKWFSPDETTEIKKTVAEFLRICK